MNVSELASRTDSKRQFYPTPKSIAYEMLSGIELSSVGGVLEPSAGKGDLAEVVIEKMKNRYGRYRSDEEEFDVDCIEIDPNLRAICREKGLRVVHDDFMTFRTYRRYGLIVLNPPYDKGAAHLLKALDMQSKGGMVICLLNAETIKNPCSYEREQLLRLLKSYDAEIEFKQNAFIGAERETGVEIAIVKANIPYQVDEESDILDGLKRDWQRRKEQESDDGKHLAKADYIDAAVDRYNFEVEAGCKLIHEYRALLPYLDEEIGKEDGSKSPMISLVMGSTYARNNDEASENRLVRAMRRKYWRALFNNPEFIKNMTSNLREELQKSVNKLAEYDFSVFNIMTLRVDMQKKLISGVESTIMKLFDDWTIKYHWDNGSANRHYFDGWRTNDAFAVGSKVIIPFYGAWGCFGDRLDLVGYDVWGKISDIEKVFDYLSGQAPDHDAVRSALKAAQDEGRTSKIKMRYFSLTFYKKGTCHISFSDLDVLKKFNLFAAKGKNWLPPCYGRKQYRDLNREEKAVVDSFEGEEAYNDSVARADYFLSMPEDSSGLKLAAGE